MPWFDKALKSVQTTAEKTAFEADKLVRVKREEGALNEAEKRVQAKLIDLGQAALALLRNGVLSHPSLAALVSEISSLEAQVQQQREKLEAIRSEQYQPAGQAAIPVAPEPAAPAVATVSGERATPVAASAMIECPNCHAEVTATVTFCPECGNRLK